jgi:hypothetical protein
MFSHTTSEATIKWLYPVVRHCADGSLTKPNSIMSSFSSTCSRRD